jgi:hypothetical protein
MLIGPSPTLEMEIYVDNYSAMGVRIASRNVQWVFLKWMAIKPLLIMNTSALDALNARASVRRMPYNHV